MKIGKWSINFRWPWVIEDIQFRPEAGDYNHYGMFCKMIPSEAIPAGMAVMIAPDGKVAPRTPHNEVVGYATADSIMDIDGKHSVVIRLGGPQIEDPD
jgi:MoaA/NifB/PqqE/SkfB family radical SAM enzyme